VAGDLAVFDFDCELRLGPFPNSQVLPIRPADRATPTPLVALAEGDLYAIDPWNDASDLIATNVSAMGQLPNGLCTIEDGELVVRGTDFGDARVIGTGVTELAVEPYGERLLFVDADGLHLIPEPEAAPVLLDPSAFSPAWAEPRVSNHYASYVTPCDGGDLVLFDPETEETTHVLGPGGASPPEVVPNGEGSLVFYLTDTVVENGHRLGTLWGGPMEGPFSRIGERGRLDTIGHPQGGRVLLRVDFDANRGTLLSWEVGGEGVEVASGVTAVSMRDARPLVLANHDGTSGDLLRVNADLTTTEVASGVPELSLDYTDSGAELVLSDYDGATGTLLLFGSDETETVATGVPRDGYAFIAGSALGYLHDFDTDTARGTLSVRMLDSTDIFDQPEVTSWTVAYWPEPGVLYAAHRAMWWAPAR